MKIKDFVEEDKLIRKQMMEDIANAPGGAKQEDTVYRDKRGRKLDMLNEMMRQQAIREGKQVAAAAEQYEWGQGSVQKEAEKLHAQELANIAAEPFARLKDDKKIDAHFREQIHADDPMAEYMMKKINEKKTKVAKELGLKPPKPEYKGPSPPPNRFNIKPGYRWDGRDRGNGFEVKVLGMSAANLRTKDAAYAWSVADM
jgi:pre-mRNA-splicing factor CWC26